eukprot:509663-Rhodomonas_salina.1
MEPAVENWSAKTAVNGASPHSRSSRNTPPRTMTLHGWLSKQPSTDSIEMLRAPARPSILSDVLWTTLLSGSGSSDHVRTCSSSDHTSPTSSRCVDSRTPTMDASTEETANAARPEAWAAMATGPSMPATSRMSKSNTLAPWAGEEKMSIGRPSMATNSVLTAPPVTSRSACRCFRMSRSATCSPRIRKFVASVIARRSSNLRDTLFHWSRADRGCDAGLPPEH